MLFTIGYGTGAFGAPVPPPLQKKDCRILLPILLLFGSWKKSAARNIKHELLKTNKVEQTFISFDFLQRERSGGVKLVLGEKILAVTMLQKNPILVS